MLRAPMLASRVVVATDEERAASLRASCSEAHIRFVPPYADGPTELSDGTVERREGSLRVAVIGRHRGTAERAIEAARQAGISCERAAETADGAIHSDADVVIALDPVDGAGDLTPALAAMAQGKVVVVFEREATAMWPALDPQTWRGRNPVVADEPVVVSIDPRDELHSLVITLRRLSQDPVQRAALGRGARRWWLAGFTPAHAAEAWTKVLQEAVSLTPPDRPADWPAHLKMEGSELMREVEKEFSLPGLLNFEL
jgi:hypothetical protein